jgi:RNA polymerase primary sigma factor
MKKKVWTAEDIEKLQLLARDVVSLNSLISNVEGEFDLELVDFIKDDSPGPEELAIKNSTRDTLMKAMKYLSARERRVLLMRYGFIDNNDMTLAEISRKYNVTRERIRQVEAKAIRKLRNIFKEMNLKEGDI